MIAFICYLMTFQSLPEILFFMQVLTVVLELLAAACGFLLSSVLLGIRVRRWLRIRRKARRQRRSAAS